MPSNPEYKAITIKVRFWEQYKARAKKNKRLLSQQLEFDLAALGAVQSPRLSAPNSPREFLKILRERLAQLERKAPLSQPIPA